MSDCLLRLNGHSNGCGQRWLAAGKSQSIDYAIEEIAGIRYWPVTISQPNRGSRHLRWRLLAIRTSPLVGAPHRAPSGALITSASARSPYFRSAVPGFRPDCLSFVPAFLRWLRTCLKHHWQVRRLLDLEGIAPHGVMDGLGASCDFLSQQHLFDKMHGFGTTGTSLKSDISTVTSVNTSSPLLVIGLRRSGITVSV
jgi:hypothetical protein